MSCTTGSALAEGAGSAANGEAVGLDGSGGTPATFAGEGAEDGVGVLAAVAVRGEVRPGAGTVTVGTWVTLGSTGAAGGDFGADVGAEPDSPLVTSSARASRSAEAASRSTGTVATMTAMRDRPCMVLSPKAEVNPVALPPLQRFAGDRLMTEKQQ
jgi:hypothetical protein